MHRCHPKTARAGKRPLPRLWLMTDERLEASLLLRSIAALPRGSGIVFRHYDTEPTQRHALFRQVRAIARRRHLRLLLADTPRLARRWGADGVHLAGSRARQSPLHRLGLGARSPLPRSVAAHGPGEVRAARRCRAGVIFLSPVFPTRSHPGGRTLGPHGFARLAALSGAPVVALGGMTPARFRRIKPLGAYGWAAIDALTGRPGGRKGKRSE